MSSDSERALNRVLEVTEKGFEKVGEAFTEQNNRLAEFETEQTLQGESLKRLLHMLDGNGVPPLAVRLSKLEQMDKHHSAEIKEINEKLDRINEKMDRNAQSMMEKMWDLLKPLLAAALAAAGVMAAQ